MEHLTAGLGVGVVAARGLVAAGEVGVGHHVVGIVRRRLLRPHQQEQQEEEQEARLEQRLRAGKNGRSMPLGDLTHLAMLFCLIRAKIKQSAAAG